MDNKLISIFAEESQEIIDSLENGLLDLEDNQDAEAINAVFRAAHTMKGNAGIVGFLDVVELTHLMEAVLDEMRKGKLTPDNQIVGLLLGAVDALKVLVNGALAGEAPARPEEVMAALSQYLGQKPAPTKPSAPEAAPPKETPFAPSQPETVFHLILRFNQDLLATGTDPLQLFLELDELGEISRVICHLVELPALREMKFDVLYPWWEVWLKTKAPKSTVENVFIFVADEGDVLVESVAAPPKTPLLTEEPAPAAIPAPQALEPSEPAGPAKDLRPPQTEIPQPSPSAEIVGSPASSLDQIPVPAGRGALQPSTVRVETNKLDKLVNLVGELVIGVARVNLVTDQQEQQELCGAVEALDHISRDLQEQVMLVRMIPVEGTFNRFLRVVRDLAGELGKKIRLKMGGIETELDKNVTEQIVDPLKHLVRNSADHGLESPQERAAAGKPETGTIWLKAYQREGRIIIEVADDGRGIDRDKVLAKAVELGLTPVKAALNDQEIFAFLFSPGFSTASEVTEVSGRGVGLDVVRENIERLKGSVEVESQPGQGTTFRVKLPLTLAIIEGMNVRVGQEILTLPLLSILESLRPKAEDIKTVEGVGELVCVRGEYLPLVRLHRLFDLPTQCTDPCQALVVIIESAKKRFGVLVDEILGEQQAVIKSLEQNYRKVKGFAGATILGDGRVSLIMDIHGLERMAFG